MAATDDLQFDMAAALVAVMVVLFNLVYKDALTIADPPESSFVVDMLVYEEPVLKSDLSNFNPILSDNSFVTFDWPRYSPDVGFGASAAICIHGKSKAPTKVISAYPIGKKTTEENSESTIQNLNGSLFTWQTRSRNVTISDALSVYSLEASKKFNDVLDSGVPSDVESAIHDWSSDTSRSLGANWLVLYPSGGLRERSLEINESRDLTIKHNDGNFFESWDTVEGNYLQTGSPSRGFWTDYIWFSVPASSTISSDFSSSSRWSPINAKDLNPFLPFRPLTSIRCGGSGDVYGEPNLGVSLRFQPFDDRVNDELSDGAAIRRVNVLAVRVSSSVSDKPLVWTFMSDNSPPFDIINDRTVTPRSGGTPVFFDVATELAMRFQ